MKQEAAPSRSTPTAALGPALAAAALALTTLVAGCEPAPPPEVPETTIAEETAPPPATRALAVLRPTEGNDARGTVRFEAMETGGLSVTAELAGLSPGEHAFHVHTYGDCTAPDGTAAGPHFPFVPLEEGAEPDFITGNLGELPVGEDGTGSVTNEIPIAELNGLRAITGRAVVVHARGNDPSAAPSGDTGARVACGVIGITATD